MLALLVLPASAEEPPEALLDELLAVLVPAPPPPPPDEPEDTLTLPEEPPDPVPDVEGGEVSLEHPASKDIAAAMEKYLRVLVMDLSLGRR